MCPRKNLEYNDASYNYFWSVVIDILRIVYQKTTPEDINRPAAMRVVMTRWSKLARPVALSIMIAPDIV